MKSVRDIALEGKRIFVRVDYNLPMDEHLTITDDNRIKATLPLIDYLVDNNARVILASHMGRPGGKTVPELSLAPAARRLTSLLNREVAFFSNCIGKDVEEKVAALENGEVLLLENLRFHRGETENDPEFARALAGLCDVYVNNAFAVSHRNQASVVGMVQWVPQCAAGFLLEKELACYNDSVKNPKTPLVAIIGGAKVSSKLKALNTVFNFTASC